MNNKVKISILIIISLLSCWRLFRPGYPSMQDDIQVFRLEQFDQCLKDGQIPCRYIAQGGFGYGYPLYNFYSPLPYSVAELFHLIGFSFINSIKLSFIIPAFLRTFGMYLFASAFFGSGGGFLSAVLYTFAPYQALNTFVRGSIGETWALALLPLIAWSLYKKKTKLSIFFLSSLFLSHNLTLLYALPLFTALTIFTKKFKYFFRTILWSIGLTALFLIPAFFEKNLTTVNTMTQGYFSYIIHFATLKQLFISNLWGYSGSNWGPVDGISFQIGFFQWLIPSIVFIYYLLNKKIKHNKLIIFFYLIGIFSIFLTHNKSTFIWKLLPFMAYFQFPWRFLGLGIFCFSFAGGNLATIINKKFSFLILISLITGIIIINYPYFKEDLWYPRLRDVDKLSGTEFIRQSAAGLMDYWPKYGKYFPVSFASEIPLTYSGGINTNQFYKNSHYAKAIISVYSSSAIINFPIVYFPNWQVLVDGQKNNYSIDPNLGLIQVELSQGQHEVELFFENSPIRTISNLISLLTLGSFIILIIREKRS